MFLCTGNCNDNTVSLFQARVQASCRTAVLISPLWASADAESGLSGQVTFPIRPLRVQDSSSERGEGTFEGDKEAGATLYAGKQPSLEKQSSPEPNFGIARVPNMPSPGSRLPPLAPQSSGRPRQAPEDFLHLFGKQGGKPSASS